MTAPESDQPQFRYARVDDAEAMAAYHHRCVLLAYVPRIEGLDASAVDPAVWVERFAEWVEDDDITSIVATIDDTPVGHTCVAIGGEHRGHVIHLFVDPDHHRHGIGRSLLGMAERVLLRAGCRDVDLCTVVGNEPAIALYVGAGWTLTDRLVDETARGVTYKEHVITKTLRDDHVLANREHWNDGADGWVERGRRSWAAEAHWGEMGIAESEVHALPDLAGRRVVELGCGTGYVSAWCLRAGASFAVGIDNSGEQLRSAQMLQGEFELRFPLVHADAENVPLSSASFDVAISEYGAAIWCDPDRWIAEAARLLRPGGDLVFLGSSPLLNLCLPDFEDEAVSRTMRRPQRGMRRFDWPDSVGVDFHVSHGEMIRILTRHGFQVVDLIELYAPDGDGPERYSYFDRDWALDYPAEEIWVARRTFTD